MPRVVELWIHGIGRAGAAGLLGVASPDDAALVAGEGTRFPAISARRARLPYVDGYLWVR